MATHRISILGASLMPDDSGECWFEPYSILSTNKIFKHNIIRMGSSNSANPTIKFGFYGSFSVPKNFVSNAKIVIVWCTTLIANDVSVEFSYRAISGNDIESLDQLTFVETVTGVDTAGSAAHERMEFSVNLTSANIAADDTVEFYFKRDGSIAADTLLGSMIIQDVLFEYTD